MRNSVSTECFICGGQMGPASNGEYRRCTRCGHETLIDTAGPQFIVNEPLRREGIDRADVRDRFQKRVSARATTENHFLIDIGAGSGRYLYFNQEQYKEHLGVEVTPECIAFARNELHLNIAERLPTELRPPSLVTMWHSLEHIPQPAIFEILQTLHARASANTRLLICVPNGRSCQAKLFGRNWTYYDVPAHLHQFSSRSLEELMARRGFRRAQVFYSFIYILAGYVLSFLNWVTPGHNYFYYRKKRQVNLTGASRAGGFFWDLVCLAALPVILPVSLLATILEFMNSDRRAVITVSYLRA